MLASLAATLLASGPAAADEPKRPVPDYDGRGTPPTKPGDVALWIPRIVFSPLYFTSEYLLRRPLGALVTAAERSHLPTFFYDLFTFGPDHKAGFAPIALFDFGFNPSVGVYAFWDDAGAKGNNLQLHASTWGAEWLAGSLTDRIVLHRKDTLSLNLMALHRPDRAYFGPGPRSLQSDLSRYGEDEVDGGAVVDIRLWRASHVQTAVGVRSASFYQGDYGGNPTVEQQVANGRFPLPDGFDRGYTAEYNRVLFALDSRQPRPAPGSGVRLELVGEQGNDVRQAPASGWLRYGATAGGFYDLTDHGRVISLSIAALFADPLGGRPVPFAELVSLGGDKPMPGFWWGRLVDRSAAVATAEYRWPIAPFLDGSIQAAVGNVFGEHLDDFEPALLRFSGALGVTTVSAPDSAIQFLVGFGTETFEHGGQIDSIRVVAAANRF
jgi:hypothetical protein